ncbi:MAG: hypothetical protein IJT44_12390 [Clostridia bacterium]|nr:hypothetical protein [Clostridia bacterium]
MLIRITAFLQSVLLTVSCFFCSIFNLPDARVDAFIAQNGGFIRGICHPNENYDLLEDGGFNWVRFDIPYPYNADGSVSGSYLAFKRRAAAYAERGFKVMAITPYPKSYIDIGGFDPVDPDNIEKTQQIALFLLEDLRDVCGAFQITNEMGIDAFTYPLTHEQAITFIGVQLEALAEVKGDFPVGYNSAGLSEWLHKGMRPYHRYCDYVGVDLYSGNTGKATARDYVKRIGRIYRITHLPVILEEFGFLSEGRPKTAEEKAQILSQYGYASEAEAAADIENFVQKLPAAFRQRLNESYPKDEWADAVFGDLSNHFYCEIGQQGTYGGFAHTPEGQAQYYADLLPRLRKMKCLAGMIIYCCQDGSVCWFCGLEGCPSETRWGLVDSTGVPKPAFETVRQCFRSPEFE